MIVTAVCAVAFPFVARAWLEGWPTYAEAWMSLCISAGTTLFLAVFVSIVEKRFESVAETSVRSAAKETADQLQEEVTEQIQEAADHLAGRLTEVEKRLDEQVREALARHDAERDQGFADLVQSQDSRRVANVLSYAADLKTIPVATGIMIPASSPANATRVTFRGISDITVAFRISGRDAVSNRRVETGEFTWSTNDDIVELFTKVNLEARSIGIDHVIFVERICSTLAEALREITDSRTGRNGRWISGIANEWLDYGWVITGEGLISRDLGTCLTYVPSTSGIARIAGPTPVFDGPAGVEAGFWELAVDRTFARTPYSWGLRATEATSRAASDNE
ncbi:hypothetical protein [Gordonia terrae]